MVNKSVLYGTGGFVLVGMILDSSKPNDYITDIARLRRTYGSRITGLSAQVNRYEN